ncbi:dienelactone hydrolase family protein [Paenibacillus sp. IB182496]|uniref:Dienelactone hydrolase family protein n=1 Tax=Paenibacillus sabuli TaxID=2772509 RepID=A0A927BS20_9BACL|nr:dienelactone hydrolase family protein [Paenibacillus sabuli]MBD2845728.1 dienelactone hydrolase family protein [Paenibacillus sabuli]
MGLQAEWIQYGQGQSGYLVRPEGEELQAPGVVVLQEIWGVDAHIRDVTARLAGAGYVALAPDLYADGGVRPAELEEPRLEAAKRFLNGLPQSAWRDAAARTEALTALPERQRAEVETTVGSLFDLGGLRAEFADKAAAAAAYLREVQPQSSGCGVAALGFCLGGALSAGLAARDSALKGAVIFYGAPPEADAIASIEAPLLGFYGALDPRITEAVPAFAQQLEEAGKSFTYHVYEDAPHAFFNDTRPSYRIDAARDSYAHTLAFLQRVLAPEAAPKRSGGSGPAAGLA